MQLHRPGLLPALFTLCLFHSALLLGAEALQPSPTPERLVQTALESELDGHSELRSDSLVSALAIDPDYAPARWHSGFVRWESQWFTPDEVAKSSMSDPLLVEYRKRRDALVDKADDHRTLAKWCHRNKLPEQERVHWAKVFEFEPDDTESLAALGLRLHGGRLLTQQQIEVVQQKAGEQRRKTQFWQPQFFKWRSALASGSVKQRSEALLKLRELSDPAAIPALQSVFGVKGNLKQSIELNRLLIETVGRIPHGEATQVLLGSAIFSDSSEVRAAAIDELKKRPLFTFVPFLIAALPDSIEVRHELSLHPLGVVLGQVDVCYRGRNFECSMSFESIDYPTGPMADNPSFWYGQFIFRNFHANVVEAVAQENQRRSDSLKDRIRFVFQQVTGFERVDDPELWEKQLNDYYGWYTSPNSITKTQYQATVASYYYHSCFPAGTPVLSQSGLTPIETIRIGDRVLAQNPQTGELVYCTVQNTTLRPSTPTVELSVGAQTIRATRGHPFWVAGRGWTVAKHLKAGDQLHGLTGAATIDVIEEARPIEVYNLVVSDQHNYFVGDQQLFLVHDNSPLQETSALVPGLLAENR